ncbi:MAG: hypothetical protein ACI9AR_000061 [Flavobacteriaceae bacterium]|jgi:hypothetical protein
MKAISYKKILIVSLFVLSFVGAFLFFQNPQKAYGKASIVTQFGGVSVLANPLCSAGQLITVIGVEGGNFYITGGTQIKRNGNYIAGVVTGFAAPVPIPCFVPCPTGQCPTGQLAKPVLMIGTS